MSLDPCVSLAFNGSCEAAFHEYERLFGGKVEFFLIGKICGREELRGNHKVALGVDVPVLSV